MSQADDGPTSNKREHTQVEYVQREQRRRIKWERAEEIEALVNDCSRALEYGQREYLHWVTVRLVEDLIPLLFRDEDVTPEDLDNRLAGHDYWFPADLYAVAEHPDRFRETLQESSADLTHSLTSEQLDIGPAQTEAAETVKRAFLSCVAIAEATDIVNDELTNRADAVGWSLKLGEHMQDEEMDLGDDVRVVSEQADYLKSLHSGPTGLGKSTGAEREAEDYLQMSFQEGRDCKVIDMVGFRQGESWLPDVPQQQDALREALADLGLPRDFTDADDLGQPDVEILVPLTTDLPSKPFPFRVDGEEFVVRPFTVPACTLRKPLLVSLIMSRLSEGEEQTIREAYDAVDNATTDWSLADLADEIRHRDELSDKHRSKAIAVLRSLQQEGFIRTREDDRTLDWERIFEDTTTRTIFSQARCSELAGLITFAYQADTIFQKRKSMYRPPDCALLFRELWEVVPHKRRRSFDSRQAAVQEAIGQIMMRLMRQNRHVRCHLIADTQEPNDLLKSIREMFNRYVVYGANRDTIKDIFAWTQNDRWKAFWGTMTSAAGEAGIVGQVEPAHENQHIEFISPVDMSPPSHHHFDVKTDGTGWHARVRYSQEIDCLPHEELRRPVEVGGPEWDTAIPDDLEVTPYAESVAGEDGPNPELQPLKAFIEHCMAHAPESHTRKTEFFDAFNGFVTAHGHEPWDFEDRGVKIRFGQKLSKRAEFAVESTQIDGDTAYQRLRLSETGLKYLKEWRADEDREE
jgi:hypothetical protein